MYDVAMTVLSCLRADTAVKVAWITAGPLADPTEAVALTPGGGRMGGLLGGTLDHLVSEAAVGLPAGGGVVELPIGPTEALIAGLPEGDTIPVAIMDGTMLPAEVWQAIAERQSVAFEIALDEAGHFTGHEVTRPAGTSASRTETGIAASLSPTSKVVVGGGGPMAEALAAVFTAAGWEVAVSTGDLARGLMATLSPGDAAVVLGHDVEESSRLLEAAIASHAGYIGSIGSQRMQQLRAEWLAYRNIEVPERVHGPAGLSIGADDPGEVAVSVAAEAIAVLAGVDPRAET